MATATDYIMFVHGLNTREDGIKSDYAKELFGKIQQQLGTSRTLKPIPLYWGDVAAKNEAVMLQTVKQNSLDWNKLWFKHFREKFMLQFIGDAALYISRYKGAEVVRTLEKQSLALL